MSIRKYFLVILMVISFGATSSAMAGGYDIPKNTPPPPATTMGNPGHGDVSLHGISGWHVFAWTRLPLLALLISVLGFTPVKES